ncbi:nicotinate-nucleotide adenylyltransferase [Peptoniphilus sp.]|jgi:nicotinate-nucleotide adenylyltransferase|uniref:nicotinate-nucleotide adenylyltransferase n=1 Tax=Peptoniphilus sp. TaxID=1971214 RepID=UPI003D8EE141
MEKYGIFGGTFNPIHSGHLMIAEYLREEMNLDKVIFIPTGNPPHKDLKISAIDRYNMVKRAISSNDKFEVTDIETKREKLSYTVDTIKELKLILKDVKLYFLIGLDTLFQLRTWKLFGELSKEIDFVVALRPKYIDISKINAEISYLQENFDTNIKIVHTPQLEISSTDLRQRIGEGKSVKYLLPSEVIEYIEENNLYK